MILLEKYHPMQLTLGAIIVAEQLATKGRQTTFAIVCRDAISWATETRDLLREIATDADYLGDRIIAAAADGIFSPEEKAELHGEAIGIRDTATSGKLIK